MNQLVTSLGWLTCASCVASLSAAAEIESGAGQEQPYRVTRWTTDQGLPQNRISCLKQTRDGYLWLGTWFGLARFDGVRFTVFDKFNTPELVNDAINALAKDTDGTLWTRWSLAMVPRKPLPIRPRRARSASPAFIVGKYSS